MYMLSLFRCFGQLCEIKLLAFPICICSTPETKVYVATNLNEDLACQLYAKCEIFAVLKI
jgi:hypothetical protein